jgi:hypothetical protein
MPRPNLVRVHPIVFPKSSRVLASSRGAQVYRRPHVGLLAVDLLLTPPRARMSGRVARGAP